MVLLQASHHPLALGQTLTDPLSHRLYTIPLTLGQTLTDPWSCYRLHTIP